MSRKIKGVIIASLLGSVLAGCGSQSQDVKKPDSDVKVYKPSQDAAAKQRAQQQAAQKRQAEKRRRQQQANAQPRPKHIPQPVGGRSFMGDPRLTVFINKMVTRHGFNRDYLNNVFSKVRHRSWIDEYMNRPKRKGRPSKVGGWSRYRAKFLKESKYSKGAIFWRQHQAALQRAYQRYQVPPEYIVAIIGVETHFGGNFGKYRVIDALTTIAMTNKRRSKYFFGELENFLLMTRSERMNPLHPVGSHAGAMGYGQFMPSSFRNFAVDFDGNGVRDLWNPTDAIGSVANYFRRHGWKPGETVVNRAAVSGTAYKSLKSGFKTNYSLSKLAQYGVRPSAPARNSGRTSLLTLSTYSGDEVWLGYNNFYAITRYNHSTYYAMAVHQLAQMMRRRMGRK